MTAAEATTAPDFTNFPVSPEAMAYIGVFKGMAADENRMGRMEGRLAGLESDVSEIKGRLGRVETRIGNVETDVAEIKGRIGGVETRLDKLEGKVGEIGDKLTSMVASFRTAHNTTIALGVGIIALLIGLIVK